MKLFLAIMMFVSIFCTGLCGDSDVNSSKTHSEIIHSHSDCDNSGTEHSAGHCDHHCVHLKVAQSKSGIPLVTYFESGFVSHYSFLYSDPHLEVLKRPPLAA